MTISELETTTLNPGIAFVLGLIYPLYKTGKTKESKEFIKGCVNYNEISVEELATHFKLVMNFLEKNNIENIDLKSNKQPAYSISPKRGFSVLIWKENESDEKCLEILTKKVFEIESINQIEIKNAFARGCFDGRSSFDTSRHFLALDVDRDYYRQDLIKSIFKQIDIDLNINRREMNHKKNDQLRIRPKDLSKLIKNICLFSNTRILPIQNFLNSGE